MDKKRQSLLMKPTPMDSCPSSRDQNRKAFWLWHPDHEALRDCHAIPWGWRHITYCNPLRWLLFNFLALLFKLDVEGSENIPKKSPSVFVGNHGSNYDGIFMLAVNMSLDSRTVVPVVWYRMLDFPILGLFLKSLQAVPVDNEQLEISQRVRSLRLMLRHLRQERSLGVLPEAVRQEQLGHFNSGAALVALQAEVPLVPFTLRGVQPLFKSLNHCPKLYGKVKVIIHPPLFPSDAEGLKGEKGAALLMKKARARIASALDYPDSLSPALD